MPVLMAWGILVSLRVWARQRPRLKVAICVAEIGALCVWLAALTDGTYYEYHLFSSGSILLALGCFLMYRQ